MKKKLNPVTELKRKIVALENTQRVIIAEREGFRDILNSIHDVVQPSSTYNSRVPFKELPNRVLDLMFYRKTYEGAIRPEREQIEAQREIIRWLVNPETADNSRELEEMKKIRGY